MGLILGPGLSSLGTLIGRAFEYAHADTVANLVMSVWSVGLAAGVTAYLPSNEGLRKLCPHLIDVPPVVSAGGVVVASPQPRGWWEGRSVKHD